MLFWLPSVFIWILPVDSRSSGVADHPVYLPHPGARDGSRVIMGRWAGRLQLRLGAAGLRERLLWPSFSYSTHTILGNNLNTESKFAFTSINIRTLTHPNPRSEADLKSKTNYLQLSVQRVWTLWEMVLPLKFWLLILPSRWSLPVTCNTPVGLYEAYIKLPVP